MYCIIQFYIILLVHLSTKWHGFQSVVWQQWTTNKCSWFKCVNCLATERKCTVAIASAWFQRHLFHCATFWSYWALPAVIPSWLKLSSPWKSKLQTFQSHLSSLQAERIWYSEDWFFLWVRAHLFRQIIFKNKCYLKLLQKIVLWEVDWIFTKQAALL